MCWLWIYQKALASLHSRLCRLQDSSGNLITWEMQISSFEVDVLEMQELIWGIWPSQCLTFIARVRRKSGARSLKLTNWPSLIYQTISAYPFLDKAETGAGIQMTSSGLSPSLPYLTQARKTLFGTIFIIDISKFIEKNRSSVKKCRLQT